MARASRPKAAGALRASRVALAAAALAAGLLPLRAGPAEAAGNPLAVHRWKFRILVISAPDASDAALRAQRAVVAGQGAGLRERDFVVVEAVGDDARARSVRAALGLPGEAFRAVLVGKDGGAKLTRAEPIPAAELFETVDAMPMRRDEMRAGRR